MYVHLGENIVVKKTDMIAVLDAATQDLTTFETNHHTVVQVAKEQVKSIVITKRQIFLLPISTIALKRRILTKVSLHYEE
ncbi:MAG TPA: hypothetical protein VLA13_08650 [Massilibacterium sp.]|nr:hypothetical protein [Massilibacterium sp.]